MQSISSSESDPGLAINWNDNAVDAFVVIAAGPRVNVVPGWLALPALTPSSCKDNMIAFVALVAGGSFGNVILAPNTLLQYGNVRDRIRDIELDPFIQECMSLMPANSVLATMALITDRTLVNATPAARVIVAPNRLVFA